MIQAGVVTQVVEGPAGPGARVGRTEHKPSHPGRHERTGAHRAGLERHHEGDLAQPPSSECNSGVPQGQDLGVCRRVARQLALVVARRHHLPADQGDGADGHVTVRHGVVRLGQGDVHGGGVAEGSRKHMAEAVGFEPTVAFTTHDFQSCRFGRSRTPPEAQPGQATRGSSRRIRR